MTLAACPNCGKQINTRADRCKYCGWQRDASASGSSAAAPEAGSEHGSALAPAIWVGLLTVLWVIAGAVLWLAADRLSKSESADGSFQGNGALIVPFLGGPALLVLGWLMLALVLRSGRRTTTNWLAIGSLLLPVALVAGFIGATNAVPTWAATQSMARGGHTATLLPNGTVLVTGGDGGYGPLATAVRYDPATGTWSAARRMSRARGGHTATLLSDGTVLVVGGDGVDAPATAERYDPTTDAWSAAGRLRALRGRFTGALLPDGRVLVLAAGERGTSAEVYDPGSGTWATTGSPGTLQWVQVATPLRDGTVLALGGSVGQGTSTAERYDPATGSWAATGSPQRMWRVVAATLLPDSKVLALGGSMHGESIAAEVYDPATRAWSATGSMITRRHDYDVALLLPNGRVLVAGGTASLPDGRGGAPVADAELYDPLTGSWSGTGNMTTARTGHSLTMLPSGMVLAAGGGTRAGPLASAELYDSVSGAWSPTGSMAAAP